jgi:hypothetical protein
MKSRTLRASERRMRHREDREAEIGPGKTPRLVQGDVDTQLLIETENRAGLRGAWRVVIARDDDDGDFGQGLPKPLELAKRRR